MDGIVVIGEGEKDEAPMLYNGEQIGDGSPPEVDVAVDPLEGTRLTARGKPSALAVVALAERGRMFDPGPCVYMEKIAGGSDIADLLDLDRPLGETLELVAKRRESDVSDLMVIMLDRDRHADAIAQDPRVRRAHPLHHRRRRVGGAAGGHRGHGRRPAVGDRRHPGGRALGRGDQVHGRAADRPALAARRRRAPAAREAGYDLDEVLDVDRLVSGKDVFFAATGVTDGDLLQGVRYQDGAEATTESLVMRSRSGTVRKVWATHNRVKLAS